MRRFNSFKICIIPIEILAVQVSEILLALSASEEMQLGRVPRLFIFVLHNHTPTESVHNLSLNIRIGFTHPIFPIKRPNPRPLFHSNVGPPISFAFNTSSLAPVTSEVHRRACSLPDDWPSTSTSHSGQSLPSLRASPCPLSRPCQRSCRFLSSC